MWKKIGVYVGIVLSIYGIYQFLKEVYELENDIAFVFKVVVLLVMIFVIIEIYNRFHLPHVFIFLGIKPNKKVIMTSTEYRNNINTDGTSIYNIKKKLLYTALPNPEELFNTFYTTENFNGSIHSIVKYHTATIRKHVLKGKKLIVYWNPNKPIKVNIPYVHKYEWYPRNNFNDDKNFMMFFLLNESGTLKVEVNTFRTVKQAWVIKKPVMFFSKLDEAAIERIIAKNRIPDCHNLR